MGISRTQRLSQRDILPSAIKGRQISQEAIENSGVTSGSFSIANGVRVTLTSTITAANANSRLAAVPYMVALFETSRTTTSLIPFGSGIASGRYDVEGPMAMPAISSIGHDDNNLVFKTAITNNSGSTQTILYDTEVRFIIAGGGGTD